MFVEPSADLPQTRNLADQESPCRKGKERSHRNHGASRGESGKDAERDAQQVRRRDGPSEKAGDVHLLPFDKANEIVCQKLFAAALRSFHFLMLTSPVVRSC